MSPASPTLEQLSALLAFSLKYGRTWRNRLSNAWFDGSDAREPNGALLRQLRNQFGPRWLRRFRFKDGLKEYRGWKLQHHPAAAAQNLFSAEQDGITLFASNLAELGQMVDAIVEMNQAAATA